MFRTVSLSVIRSSRLYIQQQTFAKQILLSACLRVPANKQTAACRLLCVQSWTPDDERKDRPKHVECHYKIKQILCIGASGWFYNRYNITMHAPMNVKFDMRVLKKKRVWRKLIPSVLSTRPAYLILCYQLSLPTNTNHRTNYVIIPKDSSSAKWTKRVHGCQKRNIDCFEKDVNKCSRQKRSFLRTRLPGVQVRADTAAFTLKFCSDWRWMVSFTPWPF